MIGVYVHVPFCDGKCPYCDFYSLLAGETAKDRYTAALTEALRPYAGARVKTVYFGGGTPNLLGAGRLAQISEALRKTLRIAPGAEITLEANPTHVDRSFFEEVLAAGFNRLSMGLQSADENELKLLGRKHSPEDVKAAFQAARAAGFENISLDLMLALPGQTWETLKQSIDFAAGLGAEHISAYMLKVEEGTPFFARGVEPLDGDESADLYLNMVAYLRELGFSQYEISNFSKPGFESRHNLVYWRGEEYLGFGPGAHSFYQGKRFYYDRDLEGFIRGDAPAPDGPGGGFAEFAMLNLRLSRGLWRTECPEESYEKILQNAKKCPTTLVQADSESIRFTPEGFLVSNALLVKLLDGIE